MTRCRAIQLLMPLATCLGACVVVWRVPGPVSSVITLRRAPQMMRMPLHPSDNPPSIAPFRKTIHAGPGRA